MASPVPITARVHSTPIAPLPLFSPPCPVPHVLKECEADAKDVTEENETLRQEIKKLKVDFDSRLASELAAQEEHTKEKYKTWDNEMKRLVQSLEEEIARKDANTEKVRQTERRKEEKY
eukprot:1607898-Pyramimonas_sp.AAC.1